IVNSHTLGTVDVLHLVDKVLLNTTATQNLEYIKILSDIATETGFQVWVELVDETGEHGIVIEDGQVRELIEEAV
ncbi:hypothetical protein ACQXY9_11175, partial [Corynebacterium diphtheriae]